MNQTKRKNLARGTMKEDEWQQYEHNPNIQKNKTTNEFRCVICNLSLSNNQGGAGGHSKAKHKLTLKGDPINLKKKPIREEPNSDMPKVTKIENEIEDEVERRENLEQQEADIEKPEYIILHDTYKDIAKSVSKLGRDAELLYEFIRLKSEYRIPPNWDFYKWIKMCVVLYNHTFKINVQLTQDLKNLPHHLMDWQRTVYYENVECNKE